MKRLVLTKKAFYLYTDPTLLVYIVDPSPLTVFNEASAHVMHQYPGKAVLY